MIEKCNQFLYRYCTERKIRAGIVLDAGGGIFSHFVLPENISLLSLDISHGQLLNNTFTILKVQGDVHTLPLKRETMKGVFCFNLIEHLDNPEKALEEIIEVLIKDGFLILGCPNRNSIKGLITRLTPTGFHRWYYRVIVGKKDRGEGHFDVFSTPFRSIVSSAGIKKWLLTHNMELLFYLRYDGAKTFGITTGSFKRVIASFPYYTVCFLAELLSFGKWRASASDILLVACKR